MKLLFCESFMVYGSLCCMYAFYHLNLAVFYLFAEITKLPPLPKMESDEDTDDYESEKASRKFQRTSGPRTKDPYASDDSWFMPITIAIALFLPILFCLCRH